ncbi:hypothetical protein COT48_02585 [Candidatus Woesearchaeota archaeon CG08_land_8_20_14_0_20_47_9]|nr:MAG: hypothetical protein AUJ69_03755 [Candidatus Woesearchaeota archaeon CG1_02_47_18]PIN72560.1 MAG: hypothetical protein COV22_02895 [Candidatus Woesearchaeota archaeon CG10_big_fil_rev_8_21_14_0_10_47_5]PIO04008.1 MAG: hypothetical protein COT48_02585 [Candidatus Woesearchaeota archaeon CG08_land_8_20_14_0_20_47_9]HII29977.1 serine hydrolase family protein [Candidatus Woesearchaeota archaeon]
MPPIIIIHGAYGSPEENWIPWLKRELERLGCRVYVPRFPTPKGQTLDNWMRVFEDFKEYVDEDTIFIGHSLGPSFILNLLEGCGLHDDDDNDANDADDDYGDDACMPSSRCNSKPLTVKAAFLVSGFTGLLNNPIFDTINKTFVDKPFNWQRIRQGCKKFYVFHSDNDPYVPLSKAKDLAANLGTKVILIKNGGHLNEKAGYTRFELLLERVKGMI